MKPYAVCSESHVLWCVGPKCQGVLRPKVGMANGFSNLAAQLFSDPVDLVTRRVDCWVHPSPKSRTLDPLLLPLLPALQQQICSKSHYRRQCNGVDNGSALQILCCNVATRL